MANFLDKIQAFIAPSLVQEKERAELENERLKAELSKHSNTHQRMYHAAQASRLTAGWKISNSSADNELVTSLTTLRSRSRALGRDSGYAKRAKVIVQNNLIGSGIGMQAQVMTARGGLNDRVNDEIEEVWRESCLANNWHTGGLMHRFDMERAGAGQVFEAGEVLFRKYYRTFGNSPVPFALEMIEGERLADEFMSPTLPVGLGSESTIRMGVEADRFFRPLAYWIRNAHPGDIRLSSQSSEQVERIPADQILHLRMIDRWPQTRGEPWLHTAARKLNDMDGYSEAEIIAARGAASYMGIIETPETSPNIMGGEAQEDGSTEVEMTPGMQMRLRPGEKYDFVNPGRPNANVDPFMRLMLREVAAGSGVSYESLSRDYSQSNYSSSRLALLDDRDLWRMLQQWFIRSFCIPIHSEWLQQAVLSRAIRSISVDEYAANPRKFEAVIWKPRGWSWVDPPKEVAAYKEAVNAGFTTVTDVIAQTGGGQDIEDVLNTRRRELDMMKEKDLIFDTDPEVYMAKVAQVQTQAPAQEQLNPVTEEEPRMAFNISPVIHAHIPERNVTIEGSTFNLPPSQIHMKQDAPVVNVTTPEIRFDIPRQEAPVVNVAASQIKIEPPVINIPQTVVNFPEERAMRTIVEERDERGLIKSTRREAV